MTTTASLAATPFGQTLLQPRVVVAGGGGGWGVTVSSLPLLTQGPWVGPWLLTRAVSPCLSLCPPRSPSCPGCVSRHRWDVPSSANAQALLVRQALARSQAGGGGRESPPPRSLCSSCPRPVALKHVGLSTPLPSSKEFRTPKCFGVYGYIYRDLLY